MKKLVLASAMALASLGLLWTPALSAQAAEGGSGQVTLPPAEFNAYQTATTESNPQQKAAALESFLKTYPQSPVKKEVLDQLMDTYRQLGNLDQELSASSRLLQVDPNDLKAILYSVIIRKTQCAKAVSPSTGVASDPQPCEDAASLAQKGLTVPKPANVSEQDWKNETGVAYPLFHSAIALADTAAKKDFADAIKEYTQELMLYPADQTTSGPALVDTLQLAEAYTKPGPSQDIQKAIWLFARVWNFAPPAYKAQIEPQLEYWYKRFHGGTDGLDAIKAQAKASAFPPADFKIAPAPTPADVAHKVVTETPNLMNLNLEDKEYILANGRPEDAQKLWSILQGQMTPVPGTVVDVTSSGLTATVHVGRLTHDFTVALKSPMAAKDIKAVPDNVEQQKTFIDTNGAPDDVAKFDKYYTQEHARITKIDLQPNATVIHMAVTQDAKNNNKADFIVNLKKPLEGKDVPDPGFEYKTLPAPELDGTYSTYTAVPAPKGQIASAQIVLSDGFVQQVPPKTAAPARRAPARRRPPARR